MRTKNSFFNMIAVILSYVVKTILVFIGKTCLIKVMGDEYNGINGLFGNVISMLSIAELGIGSAIIYNLYKPVRAGNEEKIKSIMAFYRKCYHVIAGIVLVAGLIIMPLIPSIVGKINVNENIYVLYILFLADSVASYFLSYKRSIIYVYQKNYIISICDIAYVVAVQVLQIVAILFTQNFVLFLVIGILCRIGENLLIHLCANKSYPYLKEKKVEPLEQGVKDDIKEKVKGLLFHKISSYIVLGTDNIIISKMIGVITVGFYSNYLTILNPLSNILSQIVSAVQASVGDLLVEENKEKNYYIYRRLALFNFWIYTMVSICAFYLIQDLIRLWIGEKYLFESKVLFMIILNFWQMGMRKAIGVFKEAAGIFYADRYVPVIESLVNIVVSLVLTYFFGLIGVFIGTFVSSLCLFLYSYPVLVYKPLFGKDSREYVLEQIKYFVQWLCCFIIMGIGEQIVERFISISNKCVQFGMKAIITFIFTNMILFLMYGRCEEFKFYWNKLFKHKK